MALKDSMFIRDLLDRNELPTIPVETYITDETLYKLALVLIVVILFGIVALKLSQSL